MASKSYSVRLDDKFFDNLLPGESVSGRLNTIITRYLAIMVAEKNQTWSDQDRGVLLNAFAAIDADGTREAKNIERLIAELKAAHAGDDLVLRVRHLSPASAFALIELLEAEIYVPKRKGV